MGLILLMFVGVFLPPVQNYAKGIAIQKIEAALGVRAEIGSIVYFPLTSLKVTDVSLNDKNDNQIARINEIKADIGIATLLTNNLTLKQLSIDSLTFCITQLSNGKLNISELAADSAATTTRPNVNIELLNITNSNIHFSAENKKYKLSGLNVAIRNLHVGKSEASANITGLKFTDNVNSRNFNLLSSIDFYRDTLLLTDFEAEYGASKASVNKLLIGLAPDTVLSANINNISLSDSELHIFGLPENILNTDINISGVLNASKNKLSGHNMSVNCIGKTSLSADFDIKNYSDRDAAKFRFNIKNLVTNITDISALSGTQLASPNTAQQVGDIIVNGLIRGSLSDAVFEGSVNSNIGEIHTTTNTSIKNDSSIIFNGTIDAPLLNLTRLTNGNVSEVNLAAEFDGKTNNNKLTYSHIKGKSYKLTVRDYAYKETILDIMLQGRKAYCVVDITDPNGSITAVGDFLEHESVPSYSLTAKVDSLRTGVTNLTPTIPNGNLNFSLRTEIVGNLADNINGKLLLKDFLFTGKNKDVVVNQLNIDIDDTPNGHKTLIAKSENINCSVNGNFRIARVVAEVKNQLHQVADAIFEPSTIQNDEDLYAEFDIKYTDLEQYLQFISDKIQLERNGHISGRINSRENSTNIIAELGNVDIGSAQLTNTQLTIDYTKGSLASCLSAQSIDLPIFGRGANLNISNSLTNNKLSIRSQWLDHETYDLQGTIALNTLFSNIDDNLVSHIIFEPSEIIVGDDVWRMQQSTIDVNSERIDVDHFMIKTDERWFGANGRLAVASPNDTLIVSMNKILIDNILSDDPERKVDLAGDASAEILLTSQQGKIKSFVNAGIDRFHVNRDYLERLELLADWRPTEQQLDLDVAIVSQNKCRARGLGKLDVPQNLFDLNFKIDSLSDGFLNFYLGTPIKDITGTTSGRLRLHGKLPDLKLDAHLCVHRTEFTVRQSLVKYVFDNNDSLIIAPNYIEFCNIQFSDPLGRKGNFFGHISHKMFSNLGLHINFQFNNQLVLKTTEKDNPTYYGTLYADGLLAVTGTPSSPILNISAQTAPKSEFFVQPLEKTDLAERDYIKFKSKDENVEITINQKDILNGVSARLSIDILPETQVHAVLNPRTRNMISANGRGNIRLNINKSGDLSIFGNYSIEKGTYNFSFENILNKQFVINEGGTITWAGDPYDANVDLTATYKVKASLADLVANNPNADITELRRRVPINCNILLSNKLVDPTIKFKIEVPSTQNFNQYTFDQYVNTEEETNRQAFSLLLSNRFYAVQNTNSAAANQTFLGNTATDLLSSQLSSHISNWMSQNRYNIGVGVNYRPGDEITNEEYELALSTQMLDNKIILSGNVGYGRNTTEQSSESGNFIGDFDLEVKLNKKGNIRAKAYTHTNNDVLYETSPTTQGIGISFNEEFNRFGDLFRKYWRIITGKRKKEKNATN